MESSLRVKWFNNPDKILGIKLKQNPGHIQLSQHLLIDEVLDKHTQDFKPTYINISLSYIALGLRTNLSYM
ncbi:uncharacterized protein VP01_4610g1, partial [Puccinia sorghi]